MTYLPGGQSALQPCMTGYCLAALQGHIVTHQHADPRAKSLRHGEQVLKQPRRWRNGERRYSRPVPGDRVQMDADTHAMQARRWHSAVGEECPEVRSRYAGQRRGFDPLPAVAAKELDEAMRGRDVCADRVRGKSPVVLQIGGPARRECGRRMRIQACGMVSHLRIIAATLRPRNISNSEPWRASRLRSAR